MPSQPAPDCVLRYKFPLIRASWRRSGRNHRNRHSKRLEDFWRKPEQEVRALDDVFGGNSAERVFHAARPIRLREDHTLLRLIAGFEQPTKGSILLEGAGDQHPSAFRTPVNTVFQNYALFPHMTVAQNIGFGLEMQDRPRGEVIRRLPRCSTSCA